MANSLQSLLQPEAQIVEEVVARALRPLVHLTDAGGVVPKPAFGALSPRKKILTLLLAIKALHLLNLRSSDNAGPTEVSSLGGLPVGTAKPELRYLERKKLVISHKGKYSVPTFAISRSAALLEGEVDQHEE